MKSSVYEKERKKEHTSKPQQKPSGRTYKWHSRWFQRPIKIDSKMCQAYSKGLDQRTDFKWPVLL